MVPRYFHATGEPRALPDAPAAELCDVLRLGSGEPEQAVVRDALGTLSLRPVSSLPEALRRALAAHELARGRARVLAVAELWLLDLQLLEPRADRAGLNDPLELFGRLYGPFGGGRPAQLRDGRLTVGRLDLLAGFVAEQEHAFPIDGGAGPPERCLHAWLPADRVESLAAGAGALLAYRLVPADLGAHAGNEALVAELLHGALAAIWPELAAAQPDNPLFRRQLPVPDRAALVTALQAEGWTVEGDVATRREGLAEQVSAALASVFGGANPLTRRLPAQGRLEDFVALAGAALAAVPGWPDPRTRALRALVRKDEPTGQAAPPPAAPRPPAPRVRLPPGEPTWLEDFGPTPPRAPGPRPRPPAAPRAPRAPRRGGSAPPTRPAWMDDFES